MVYKSDLQWNRLPAFFFSLRPTNIKTIDGKPKIQTPRLNIFII